MKTSCGILFSFWLASVATITQAQAPGMQKIMTSAEHTTAAGNWHYELQRSAIPWLCGNEKIAQRCVDNVVVIANQSALTLECRMHVDYKRANGEIASSFDTPAVVYPGARPKVHRLSTVEDITAEITQLDCLARAPYKRIAKVQGCKYDMRGTPFETYYPAAALQQSLQGPVIVSFLLDRRDGTAKEVAVAESSMSAVLDQAAVRFVKDQIFGTNCVGTRFDLLMRFKFNDQVNTALP